MEKIKEKVAYLKLWLTFFVTIDVSCSAWFFNNSAKSTFSKLFLCVYAIILTSGLIGFLHNKTYKLIKSIEE